jgi:hypothetical protein
MTQIASNINVIGNDGTDIITTDAATLANVFETDSKVYDVLSIEISYQTDFHTVQLPTASDTVKTASFAVLANPTMRKVVSWSVRTTGDQPTMPTPYTSDPNEVLLFTNITPSNVTTDGTTNTTVWELDGEYVYGVKDRTQAKLYAPAPPNLTLTLSQTEIQSSNFKSGITNPYSPNVVFGNIKA